MVIAQPTAGELLQGVIDWLGGDDEAGPGSFSRRVAANALAIVRRDVAQGQALDEAATHRLRTLLGAPGDRMQLEALLVAELRAGTIAPDDPRLLAHLAATALDTLAIDQPRYAHELKDGR